MYSNYYHPPHVNQSYYNSRFYPTHNEYMTAAVGVNTPYQCGQAIKIM